MAANDKVEKVAVEKVEKTAAQSAKKAISPSVHFTLQGKGGVGKSFVSAILAQYFGNAGANVECVDTDPVNQTLVNYAALNAKHVNLLEGSKIDERNFDNLMEDLLSQEKVFVVDNGSASFVALSNYIIENNAIDMLQENGKDVYIHCVITGGQALRDTLTGFKALADQANTKNIIVWLNEFFGPIEHEGKSFNEMKVYHDNVDKIRGMIRIPKRNQDTFGRDIEEMATSKLTFDEAINGKKFTIMAKQRIKTVQRDIFTQLEAVGF